MQNVFCVEKILADRAVRTPKLVRRKLWPKLILKRQVIFRCKQNWFIWIWILYNLVLQLHVNNFYYYSSRFFFYILRRCTLTNEYFTDCADKSERFRRLGADEPSSTLKYAEFVHRPVQISVRFRTCVDVVSNYMYQSDTNSQMFGWGSAYGEAANKCLVTKVQTLVNLFWNYRQFMYYIVTTFTTGLPDGLGLNKPISRQKKAKKNNWKQPKKEKWREKRKI